MQVEKLQVRLKEKDTDLLEQLLEDAEAEILDYCNRDALLPRMLGLQRELAIIYIVFVLHLFSYLIRIHLQKILQSKHTFLLT